MAAHFKVTLTMRNVKKMYSNAFKHVDWPTFPFKAMDIGCGSGRLLLEILEPLLPKNYSHLVGTDFSEQMINHCNTLKKDHRITFEPMDIESKIVPEKFVNNFDLLCSSFVLQYAIDVRQALLNCKTLLKPRGQLVFIYLYKSHPLYDIYKGMSMIDEWRPYTKDFMNYSTSLGPDNPIDTARHLFEDCGLKICDIQLNDDPYEASPREFLELMESVDAVYCGLPAEKRRKYKMAFAEVFGSMTGFSLDDEEMKKNLQIHFPAVVVHARKNS